MAQSLRIDCHNGGPIVYNQALIDNLKLLLNDGYSINDTIRKINKIRQELFLNNCYPEYVDALDQSNVSVMIRTVGIFADPPFSSKSILDDIKNLKKICTASTGFDYVITSKQLIDSIQNKKRAYIPMIESIEDFENNLDLLFEICNSDIPIVQPVYNTKNFFGSGCFDENDSGLSKTGRLIIDKLCKIGTLIDHSHISERTALDIIYSGYPHNIATHSFSNEISPSPRGKSDLFFEALHQSNGFVAITVNPNLISNHSDSTKKMFLKNTEHLLKIVGEDALGIGTDWDGPMPTCICDLLNEASTKLGNPSYFLSTISDLYNTMADWNKLVEILNKEFGNSIMKKMVGENAFMFLKQNLPKSNY